MEAGETQAQAMTIRKKERKKERKTP